MIKIRGKLLIYNVRKGQHVSVPLKLFDSNFQLSLFFSVSSISLLFQFFMVAFDILFFFFSLQKEDTAKLLFDEETKI